MWKQNKRFIQLTGVLLLIVLGSWSFVLGPVQKQIGKYQKKSKFFQSEIVALYASEYPPEEEVLTNLQQQHISLEKNVNRLMESILLNIPTKDIAGPGDFRTLINEKAAQLSKKANTLGVTFDKELGFKWDIQRESPFEIYYVNLDITCRLLSLLLDIKKEEEEELRILAIKHPHLERTRSIRSLREKPFLIELQFAGRLKLITRFIHHISTARDIPFLSLQNMYLKNTSQYTTGMIQAKIALTATNKSNAQPIQKKQPTETTAPANNKTDKPIWKRF